MELSPYDELPVHQTSRPLSVVANTDPGFDDGYFFGAFSASEQTFLFCGLRVNPNTDLVGGYVGLNRRGVQRTVRLSRTWRELCDTVIGPYRFSIVEPRWLISSRAGTSSRSSPGPAFSRRRASP